MKKPSITIICWQKHFEARLRCSEDLLANFVCQTDQETIPDTKITQWGRCIGSYLQLLTKAIRFTQDPSEKEKANEKAEAVIPLAFRHLSTPKDISFCHQNLCDLLVELGRYEEAMAHLCRSVKADIPANFTEQADFVLSEAEPALHHAVPFLFLHYAQMMHRCLLAGSPFGDILLDRLIEFKKPISSDYADLKGKPHPEGVILWHLGASLACRAAYQPLAKEMLEAAWQSMKDTDFIFRTIGLAVRAETITAGLQGRLPGKAEVWKKAESDFFSRELPRYMEKYPSHSLASFDQKEYTMQQIFGRMPY